METINLKFSDFRIVPDIQSVHREAIPDEEYFSKKYSLFISNSRLKLINPAEGGSPQAFLENRHIVSPSLSLGTAIHSQVLTPEEYIIAPKIGKPGAKLGLVIDEIERLLKSKKQKFDSFEDLIKAAAIKVNYYTNIIDSKISGIKSIWYNYAKSLEKIKSEAEGKEILTLCDKDWDIAQDCIQSIKKNQAIMSKLHPVDMFGDPIESYFEDALFMDYIVTYQGKQCAILRFKLKIDNWTLDEDNKIVTVNDLKTSGHGIQSFMEPDGSFFNYHYFRQLQVYENILEKYLLKSRGISKASGWTFKRNILAVETIFDHNSQCFAIGDDYIYHGQQESEELLKRVAACEIFGYDKEYIFE